MRPFSTQLKDALSGFSNSLILVDGIAIIISRGSGENGFG